MRNNVDVILSLGIEQPNSGSYGFNFNGITDHRESISFEFDRVSEELNLEVTGFDIDSAREVSVSLNGSPIGYLSVTNNNDLGPSTIALPTEILVSGSNLLTLTQSNPGWKWGVTNLLLAVRENTSSALTLTIDQLENRYFGFNFNGITDHRESISFEFDRVSEELNLEVTGFDIDSAREVSVSLNGSPIGYLSVTNNNDLGPSTIALPTEILVSGSNLLTLTQSNPGSKWGVTNLLLSEPDTTNINSIFPELSNHSLVFSDEFNSTQLDPTKWQTGLLWGPYLSINNEEQLYVDTLGINAVSSYDPFVFTGDSLIIRATEVSNNVSPTERPPENDPIWDSYPEYRFNGPSANGPGYQPEDVNYLSGIITSYDAFKMTHGYVEARVKLPAGRGLWPAFWLLNTHYVEDSPEIDVVEFLGQNIDEIYQTYHYFDIENNWAKISTPTFTVEGTDWTQEFHTFGVAWTPNEIVWYVDGEETRRITDQDYKISTQAMYLIANLAVGGDWPGSPDSSTAFPAEFEIDYIRAYKKIVEEPVNLSADFQMVFNDEFNGSALDTNKWNTNFLWGPYLTINNEEQYYVDSNGIDADKTYTPFSFGSEGSTQFLSINARTAEDSGPDLPPAALPDPTDPLWVEHPEFQQGPYPEPKPYTSGIITSYDAFKFVNGYAEIRARVPAGDGLWPAFWLLNAYYVGPLPEIDIMEILGEDPTTAYHTFHRSDSIGQSVQSQYISNRNTAGGFSDGFHTYGVHWQPGKITWYVDGTAVHTYEETDPNRNDAYQLMYVIANLAVGGNFNSQPVDPSKIPAAFDIDYIRVYQEKDTP